MKLVDRRQASDPRVESRADPAGRVGDGAAQDARGRIEDPPAPRRGRYLAVAKWSNDDSGQMMTAKWSNDDSGQITLAAELKILPRRGEVSSGNMFNLKRKLPIKPGSGPN
jgi:hypothetical protein